MELFYKPNIDGERLILDPNESYHCIRVLRYREGQKLSITDGTGSLYYARITNADPGACALLIYEKKEEFERLPYTLHIGIAPTKQSDRFEWFLEKATEIGITEITPIICNRSERRNLRIDRMEKVIIAAMKQSIKAYKPRLNQAVPFQEWLRNNGETSRLIAHCNTGEKQTISNINLRSSITIAIGPEGDFSNEEVKMALDAGFSAISLGNYRLRTETAAVVACTAISLRYS